jgi:O-antigen ligase
MHRLFYHQSPEAFYFAAEAKAILAVCPELRRSDPRGLGEFVACSCVLEDRAIFEGIRALPPGSAWTIRAGAPDQKQAYFQPKEWEDQASLDAESYYRELRSAISRNLPRYSNGRERVGMTLTGGLDTRVIMACRESPPGSLPCYTFGGMFRDCQDVRIARRVAKLAQQTHQVITVGKDFLDRFPHYAERTVRLTEGGADVYRSCDLYVSEKAREIAPVKVVGTYGSEIVRQAVMFNPTAPEPGLFRPEFLSYVQQAEATYVQSQREHPVTFAAFRQAPWYHHSVLALEQSQLTVRSPYLDNEFVRTVYRAPGPIGQDDDIRLRLICNGNPVLARIPSDRGVRANGLVLLFFLYCGISILWSDFPGVSFRHWIRSLGDPLMVLLVLTEADLSATFTRLITRPAFVLIPLSVLLIKYYPDLGRSYNRWTFLPAYTGVTTNKNSLGLLCLLLGIGSLWCFLAAFQGQRGRSQNRRLIAYAAVLMMIFWLFKLAESMTSLSCFILASGLMVIPRLSRTARKPLVLHLLMVVALSVPLVVLFSGAGGGMLESLGRDPTLTGRTTIWKVVLSAGVNPLGGAGFESFWLGNRVVTIWERTMEGLQEAHNGYLEVYLNLGWIGIALIVGLMAKGYRNVVVMIRRDPGLGGLMLALFFSAVVYNFTEAGFRMMSISWISLLLVTITSPQAVLHEDATGAEPVYGFTPVPPLLTGLSGGFPEDGTSVSG